MNDEQKIEVNDMNDSIEMKTQTNEVRDEKLCHER
jgi:hypothetical protein